MRPFLQLTNESLDPLWFANLATAGRPRLFKSRLKRFNKWGYVSKTALLEIDPFLGSLLWGLVAQNRTSKLPLQKKVIDFEQTSRLFLVKIVNLENAHFLTEIRVMLAHF